MTLNLSQEGFQVGCLYDENHHFLHSHGSLRAQLCHVLKKNGVAKLVPHRLEFGVNYAKISIQTSCEVSNPSGLAMLYV